MKKGFKKILWESDWEKGWCHGLEPYNILKFNLNLIQGSACYIKDGFNKSIGLWIMRGMWVDVWYIIWNGFRYIIQERDI